ncbi:MAG TPA: type II toxin-antitoxin system RatA family toxin [Allosphingosinicella sp.]|nr:type II toxin-antitoxin system RatA family toxin [Allosphingosinicella sp.]
MPRHSEKRTLPYSPDQLFDLVADVKRYPEFLPWVAATRIRSDSETLMIADLAVGFKSLKETFTSRVTKQRPRKILVEYVEGPLKYLKNDWEFEPDGRGGTRLGFCVDFAFKSRVFEAIAGQMFDRALRRMIAAFEARAHVLYGDSSTGISSSSAQSAA